MPSRCEVHFLDVGQGAASVILYHNPEAERNEAIVLDCGPTEDGVPLALLQDRDVYVRALILTHYHADHTAGAKKIIRTFAKRDLLGDIYLVNDQSEGARDLAGWLLKELKAKRLQRRPLPLEPGTSI